MSKLTAILEDGIMVKGCITTAGSKILGNFTAPFTAAVAERLNAAGIEMAGRVGMKEFGLPGLVESAESQTCEAVNALLSGQANGQAEVCLCNDPFGYYRRQAAENNLFYLQPTYGTVPRYGLVPTASSMDQIGVLCKSMEDGMNILRVIAGRDPRDGAMFPEEKYEYADTKKVEDLSVLVPFGENEAVNDFSLKLKNKITAPLKYFEAYKPAAYILACAEVGNNISRYDGVKFGYRSPNASDLESLYVNTRTEALGLDAKLTAIMGALVLSGANYARYYEKAMRVRRLVRQAVNFDGYDLIALPANADCPLPALAGLPAVSFTYKGCGVQLIANIKEEAILKTACEVARQ